MVRRVRNSIKLWLSYSCIKRIPEFNLPEYIKNLPTHSQNASANHMVLSEGTRKMNESSRRTPQAIIFREIL